MSKPTLSIVILSYNTSSLLRDCLNSLAEVKGDVNFETIVVDNASIDDSLEMLSREFKDVTVIKSSNNVGFARGNNLAKPKVSGEYVLFLNSDTIVPSDTIKKTIDYLKDNPKVGALTCKLVLPSGKLDKDARRAFPTPWIAFTHFSSLDKLFPSTKLFGSYWYGYKSPDETHEVDVIQGAYFLTRRKILDEVGWFSEDYFLDGEDIDLSWKIKNKGWKIIYYSAVSIVHIKGASKGKNRRAKVKPSFRKRAKFRLAGVNSMEIFYRKRLWSNYPLPVNMGVIAGIKFMKLARLIQVFLQ